MKLLDENAVGLLQQLDFFRRDVAEDAHRQAGAGKRMAFEDIFGNAEILADTATSSLKSSRSGSISFRFIFSGRPPTLWCDFIVTDEPRSETDSITSG